MKILPNVTLIGVDCVDLKRLQLAADISTKEITFGAVKLLTSIKSDDSRVIKIPRISSTEEYSDFMIKELDKYVDTEFALVFQHDGFILNPSAWEDEFLQYDYTGSPWYHLGELHVGNGGFSLRSKKLISWLANNWKSVGVPIHPEDVFISKFARTFMEQEAMKFAPLEVASRFSMEGTRHSVVWNGEFGVHGIGYTDISRWLDKHPAYKGKVKFKMDDYVILMRKYPIHDGTVHTLDFRKQDMTNYKKSSRGVKNYEARTTKSKYDDLSNIKVDDMIVFKRSGVSFKKVPVPAFEKKVKKIENFKSFADLRGVYPHLHVTYPWQSIKKWKRPFIKFFGDSVYPKDESYTVFWFT